MVVMVQSCWLILGDLHGFKYLAISGASYFTIHDVVISSPRDREPPVELLSRNGGKNITRENGELGKAVKFSILSQCGGACQKGLV